MRESGGARDLCGGVRGVDLLEVAPEQTLGREVLVAPAPPAQQPRAAAARRLRKRRLSFSRGAARQVERRRRAIREGRRAVAGLTSCSYSNVTVVKLSKRMYNAVFRFDGSGLYCVAAEDTVNKFGIFFGFQEHPSPDCK